MIVMGVIALALLKLSIPAFSKYIILTIVTFALSNMIIYTYHKTSQKKINMKTITTTAIVVFFLGVGFNKNHASTAVDTDLSTKTQSISNNQSISIHEAVITGNLEAVKNYIITGTDLNRKEPSGGSSPLITAAVFGKTEIALALINAGADVNFVNNDGSTPLHTAAFFCHPKIVKALLENGADASLKNNAGSTPLDSVLVPFEMVKGIYDYFGKTLGPLGLEIDYERIKATRPEIAEMIQNNSFK
jgi:hypothetical protein